MAGSLRLSRTERPRQGGDNLEKIPEEAVIAFLENGRIGIVVDGHDHLGCLHACEMLNGTGNSAGDVEPWADRFSGLADLQRVGRKAGVHGGPGGANRRPENGCALFQYPEVFRGADGAPTGDDDLGFGDIRPPGGTLLDFPDHQPFRGRDMDLV